MIKKYYKTQAKAGTVFIMSGHSRWANIKHKKARSDAKKGKVFTKLVKEIMVAARHGGPDASANARLRLAIEKAKAENLPADNIDRAIKKGSGEMSTVSYEEGCYEGYGPGGVAVIVNFTTDNRNRTASDVRHAFTSHGGSLGLSGSVAWMFEKRGLFTFDSASISEDSLIDSALKAGADDVVSNPADKTYEVYTDPALFAKVKAQLDSLSLKYSSADITMVPKTVCPVQGKTAGQVLKLLDALEDLDDVSSVYANFDMPDEDLENIA